MDDRVDVTGPESIFLRKRPDGGPRNSASVDHFAELGPELAFGMGYLTNIIGWFWLEYDRVFTPGLTVTLEVRGQRQDDELLMCLRQLSR